VAEQAAEWHAIVSTPQEIRESVQAGGPHHRVWKRVVARLAQLDKAADDTGCRDESAGRAVRQRRTGRRRRRGPCFRELAGASANRGRSVFRLVSLRDGDGKTLDPERWTRLIDLSLREAGERYASTADLPGRARYGHFTSANNSWEQIAL